MRESADTLWRAYNQSPTVEHRNRLIERFAPVIASLANKVSRKNPQISFEEAQSAGLIGLLESLDRYHTRHKAGIVTYAYRRIHGSMLDEVRSLKQAGFTRIGNQTPNLGSSDTVRDSQNGAAAHRADARMDLDALSRSLSPRQGAVLRMRYLEHRTIDNIAAETGLKRGTIHGYLTIARRRLKEMRDVGQADQDQA